MTGSTTIVISKRKMRRVAAFLLSVAVALDGTIALALNNNNNNNGNGNNKGSRIISPKTAATSTVGAVLPPLIESGTRRRQYKYTPNPQASSSSSSRKKNFRKKALVDKAEQRSLPEIIPRLSDLYHSTAAEQQQVKPPSLVQKDATSGGSSSSNNNSSSNTKKKNEAQWTKSRQREDRNDGGEETSSSSSLEETNESQSSEPWKASFQSSIRTQGRIKKEFKTFNVGESPNLKAKRILKAFLSTPPTQCNAANVVGALTFSAKALGSRRIEPDEQLRSMLLETLDVLYILVDQRLLSTRQLCNACWAIAKHYDRDNTLLPPPPEATYLSSDEALGTAERWDILELPDKMKEQQQRVDETVDEIARQLTTILEESSEELLPGTDAPPLQAKVGEICMTSWAYGKLRPRSTPPGWEIPPQLGKLPNAKSEAAKMARTTSMITFEQWGSFGSGDKKKKNDYKDDDDQESLPAENVTGRLFDAIGASLCRSPAAMGIVDTKNDDETNNGGTVYASTCLETCSWSELANVGWSFASHGRCKSKESQMLLQGLAREASFRLEVGGETMGEFLIRDIAQLLWALGTLQADNFRLADDLVGLVEALSGYLRLGEKAPSFGRGRRLLRWSCADLVQVALSLAHARIDDLNLLRAIYEESHHRLLEDAHSDFNDQEGRSSFRPWEVSILLWAQARLYLKAEQDPLFEEFTADAPKFFLSSLSRNRKTLAERGICSQEQANIVWSLTVLENHQSQDAIELINRIFHEAANACNDQNAIQLEHAHQLWQAYFLLQEESPESVANVPTWFASYLQDKWKLEKARGKLSSARHKSLSQSLNLMGVRHFNEHDEDIDVAIVLKKDASWTHETDSEEDKPGAHVSVAVEFDGPNHFTREKDGAERSTQPRALGHTVLKYRLLKKQGWTVVRVPYFEFDRIPFWASMERQRYLQRKLKTHANIQFSEVDVSEYKALKPNRESRFD